MNYRRVEWETIPCVSTPKQSVAKCGGGDAGNSYAAFWSEGADASIREGQYCIRTRLRTLTARFLRDATRFMQESCKSRGVFVFEGRFLCRRVTGVILYDTHVTGYRLLSLHVTDYLINTLCPEHAVSARVSHDDDCRHFEVLGRRNVCVYENAASTSTPTSSPTLQRDQPSALTHQAGKSQARTVRSTAAETEQQDDTAVAAKGHH